MRLRTASALVAVLITFAIFCVWRAQGLLAITFLAGLGCIFEFARLIFARLDAPPHLRFSFMGFAAIVLFTTGFGDESLALPISAVAAVFFFTMSVLSVSKPTELPVAMQASAAAAMGLAYCGVFAGLILRLLQLPMGITWFFGLLAIVFAGDTCAYLAGRAFGRRKLIEAVSPKKTIEGAVGGLVGSALVGLALSLFFFPQLPAIWLLLAALATGAFAQIGDLFESLLKRVAEVKDSGTIMPGHGGVLDRLDGVLFAGPVFYILAKFLAVYLENASV